MTRESLGTLVRYAFCCLLQILLTTPNFSFRGRREQSTGLQLQKKDQDKIIWPSVTAAHVRNQGVAKGAVLPLKY